MTNQPNNEYFDVDDGLLEQFNESMKMGGAITLPFPTSYFAFKNGNRSLRPLADQCPALYFGGWAADAEKFEDAVDEYGDPGPNIVLTEMTSRENKTFTAYTARSLLVAPIGYRVAWFTETNQATIRTTEYSGTGSRHRIQVLAMLGIKQPNGAPTKAWGPIVLTAKGYQVQNLINTMRDWQSGLDRNRKQVAPKVPAWGFWMVVGTFGDEPVIKMVGKGASQSPITPISMFAVKEFNREVLAKLFVGKDTLNVMADLMKAADEWLKAWREPTPNLAPAGAGANGQPAFDEPPEDNEAEPSGEDIPF